MEAVTERKSGYTDDKVREDLIRKADAAILNLENKFKEEAPHLRLVRRRDRHYWVMARGAMVAEFWPISRRYKTRVSTETGRYKGWIEFFKICVSVANGLKGRGGANK